MHPHLRYAPHGPKVWTKSKTVGNGVYGGVRLNRSDVVTKKIDEADGEWTGFCELAGLSACVSRAALGYDLAVRGGAETHLHLIRGTSMDSTMSIYVRRHVALKKGKNSEVEAMKPHLTGVTRAWMLDIARELAAAHERGVTHGDLKMDNFIVLAQKDVARLKKKQERGSTLDEKGPRWTACKVAGGAASKGAATVVDWGLSNSAPLSMEPIDTIMQTFNVNYRAPESILWARTMRTYTPRPVGQVEDGGVEQEARSNVEVKPVSATWPRPRIKPPYNYADILHNAPELGFPVSNYGGCGVMPPSLYDPFKQDVYALGLCILQTLYPQMMMHRRWSSPHSVDILTHRVVLFGPPPKHLACAHPAYRVLRKTFADVVPEGGACATGAARLEEEGDREKAWLLRIVQGACAWDPHHRLSMLSVMRRLEQKEEGGLRESGSWCRSRSQQVWPWEETLHAKGLGVIATPQWTWKRWCEAVSIHLSQLLPPSDAYWQLAASFQHIQRKEITVCQAWLALEAWFLSAQSMHAELCVSSPDKGHKRKTPEPVHTPQAEAGAGESEEEGSEGEEEEERNGLFDKDALWGLSTKHAERCKAPLLVTAMNTMLALQLGMVDEHSRELEVHPVFEDMLVTRLQHPHLKGPAVALLQQFFSTVLHARCINIPFHGIMCWDDAMMKKGKGSVCSMCASAGAMYSAANCALYMLLTLVPDVVLLAPAQCAAAAVRLVSSSGRMAPAAVCACFNVRLGEVQDVMRHAAHVARSLTTGQARGLMQMLQEAFSRPVEQRALRWPLILSPVPTSTVQQCCDALGCPLHSDLESEEA